LEELKFVLRFAKYGTRPEDVTGISIWGFTLNVTRQLALPSHSQRQGCTLLVPHRYTTHHPSFFIKITLLTFMQFFFFFLQVHSQQSAFLQSCYKD